MSPTIREWPSSERPRERLARLRPDALAARELLAIVLGSGAAGRSALELAGTLLARFGGSLRTLAAAELSELESVPGIGPAKSAATQAALALGRRLAAEPARATAHIRGPSDVHARLGPQLRDRRQEEFWVIYLDTQNRILLDRCLTIGLLNSSLVHPREVFGPAIAGAAASVILAHNHPSGDAEPSPEDLRVTSQLVQCGRLLGIPVRDHVVLGDGAYVSLMERGLCGGSDGGGAAAGYTGHRGGGRVAERSARSRSVDPSHDPHRSVAAALARASVEGPLVRVPVWVTRAQFERMRVLTRTRGRSMSELIRGWIDDRLARDATRTPALRRTSVPSASEGPSDRPQVRRPRGCRCSRRTAR